MDKKTEKKGMNRLVLAVDGYEYELATRVKMSIISHELRFVLTEILDAYFKRKMPISATQTFIQRIKEEVPNGIILESPNGYQEFYEIMVWVPEPGKDTGRRSIFVLVRDYPEGQLKKVTDL